MIWTFNYLSLALFFLCSPTFNSGEVADGFSNNRVFLAMTGGYSAILAVVYVFLDAFKP